MEKGNQSDKDFKNNKVERNTEHLSGSEMEKLPFSDDDYRLPHEVPQEVKDEMSAEDLQEQENNNKEEGEDYEEGNLIHDEDSDITENELLLLEESERDTSSDETRASDLLDDTDEDGDELNEGSNNRNAFDLGEDLDMPNDVNNPDIDEEDERY